MTEPMTTVERRSTPVDRVVEYLFPPLDRLGERAPIAAPLVLILLVSAVTAAQTQAWGLDLSPDPSAVQAFGGLVWILTLLTPLAAALKATVLGVVLWSLLVVLDTPVRLRSLLSILLYGETILALQGPVLLFILLWQGGVRTEGAPVPSGLDYFVDPSQPVLFALAQGVTPFHLAWFVFTGLALAAAARVPRWRGLALAGTLWVLVVGLGVLRAAIIQGGA